VNVVIISAGLQAPTHCFGQGLVGDRFPDPEDSRECISTIGREVIQIQVQKRTRTTWQKSKQAQEWFKKNIFKEGEEVSPMNAELQTFLRSTSHMHHYIS
jgi:hypothetical protein